MNGLSPVLVSVYNRYDHFKRVIENLKKSELARQSTLYIVSDAAFKSEDEVIVSKIREYCKGIEGFKEVIIIARDVNLGSHKSINKAIDYVLDKHSRLIFLEDDVLVSSDFLIYMNRALYKYQDYENIFSVSAYGIPSIPPRTYKQDVYLWSRYSGWGVGIWKAKWDKVDWNLTNYPKFRSNKKLVREFKKISYSTMELLDKDWRGELIAGDVKISFHMFLNNLYSIYPTKTKVINIGFDGTGEHCGVNQSFEHQKLSLEPVVFPTNILPNRVIYKWRSRYHFSFRRNIIYPIIKLCFHKLFS